MRSKLCQELWQEIAIASDLSWLHDHVQRHLRALLLENLIWHPKYLSKPDPLLGLTLILVLSQMSHASHCNLLDVRTELANEGFPQRVNFDGLGEGRNALLSSPVNLFVSFRVCD